MYSRNTWERRDSYSLPPGYDGSRFRRRHRRGDYGSAEDDVIIVPDSSYAVADNHGNGELSVGGIPTDMGKRRDRERSADAEYRAEEFEGANSTFDEDDAEPTPVYTEAAPARDKLSDILGKLGFSGGLSSDDLLLCAVIFIIASDKGRDTGSVGDVLLILALLLGVK